MMPLRWKVVMSLLASLIFMLALPVPTGTELSSALKKTRYRPRIYR